MRSKLKELRESRGMSQGDLAKAVTEEGFNLKVPTISRFENTGKGIGFQGRITMAKVLDCDPMELL